jgi:hypothetical protein
MSTDGASPRLAIVRNGTFVSPWQLQWRIARKVLEQQWRIAATGNSVAGAATAHRVAAAQA